jgi:DNA adenine methylase
VEVTRPFLRWAGSKRKQLRWLCRFWQPAYSRYVEPFAGSACLFFEIQPERALIADKNADLIETYMVVRDNAAEVFDRIACLPRTSSTYYRVRERDTANMSPIERAVRFIYLNRNCFNGIYRTNGSGRFNVPFATSRAGAFVSRDEFLAAAEMLERATLRAWDFGTTLSSVRGGDFVYLDPPYAVKSRRVFREYGATLFSFCDVDRLAKHLERIDSRGAAFLVSYADCTESRQLARPWNSFRIRVRRHVAGFAAARRSAYELLISNVNPTRLERTRG